MQIIDQHIAHERFLYEQLKENKTITSQLLLTSELVKPDTEQILMLKENLGLISKYGFELDFIPLEPVSNTLSSNAVVLQAPVDSKVHINQACAVRLKRIPQMLANKNPEKSFLI